VSGEGYVSFHHTVKSHRTVEQGGRGAKIRAAAWV
jgi:hypothetical protein